VSPDHRRWPDLCAAGMTLALVAFALDMLWELIQLPLYAGHESLDAGVLYVAATDDAGLIVAAAVVGRVIDG
jgi:hypothetical protein